MPRSSKALSPTRTKRTGSSRAKPAKKPSKKPGAAKPRVFTEFRKQKFLEALSENPCISTAAAAAGLSRSRLYDLYNDDPEFRAKWDRARLSGLDRIWEEGYRRAMGYRRQVLDKTGNLVEVEEFSDRLLCKMLELEHSRPRDVRVTGADGGPIQQQHTLGLPRELEGLTPEQLLAAADNLATLIGDLEAEGDDGDNDPDGQ